jgi:hypothetical protein
MKKKKKKKKHSQRQSRRFSKFIIHCLKGLGYQFLSESSSIKEPSS